MSGSSKLNQIAFELEIKLIAKYGRRDLKTGTLCNLTDGGEGAAGSLIGAANMRKLRANPEFLKARLEGMKALHANLGFAKANAERMRKRWANPRFVKARMEAIKAIHAEPEFV